MADKQKHVLVVDDEPNVAVILAASLEKLGEEYIVETARNGDEALKKMQEQAYSVLLTDYHMPGMNGLALAETVRQNSPQTQVILMTAYGTERLRGKVERLNVDGYIDKPFSAKDIRKIVQDAVERTNQIKIDEEQINNNGSEMDEAVYQHLNNLQVKTGARCVLLISSSGYPVSVVGLTGGLDISSVSAMVAANFLAAVELANLLGNNDSIFKSSYHEGNDYNIYSYDINSELLIAVIFSAESKPGVIWFYTKQTAAELLPIVENFSVPTFDFASEDVSAAVDIEFNRLFGDDDDEDEDSGQDEPKLFQEQPSQPAQSGPPPKAMSFEEAVKAGLVPSQIKNREMS